MLRVLLFLIFLSNLLLGQSEDIVREKQLLLEHYAGTIESSSPMVVLPYLDAIDAPIPGSRFRRLHFHATPFAEGRLRRWRGYWSWLLGKEPEHRLSAQQLRAVAVLAEELRTELGLEYLKGWHGYPWTEQDFLLFEGKIAERIESLKLDFDERVFELHEGHTPPLPYELSRLQESYLKIWVLAAFLQIENERYLSAFPWAAPHLERLEERQEPLERAVGECRVALLRMSQDGYWRR